MPESTETLSTLTSPASTIKTLIIEKSLFAIIVEKKHFADIGNTLIGQKR